MTLAELENEILLIVNNDAAVQPFVKTWLLDALDQIALDFHLPALRLITPYELTTTDDVWLYDLPAHYHKYLFEARDADYTLITLLWNMHQLRRKDPDHDETGDNVTAVAVQDRKIGTYPMADDTVYLWFYQKPSGLVVIPEGEEEGDDDDRLTCLPSEFHRRLLIPKVVMMNLEAMIDAVIEPPMQSMLYWFNAYNRGLYGTPRGELGLVHWLARQEGNQPRAWLGRNHL